jgi:hypothetical protein
VGGVRERDRLASSGTRPRRAGAVEHHEVLDVAAGDLTEAVDLGVGVGQPQREHGQAVSPAVNGRGTQRRRDDVEVADREFAHLRLRDVARPVVVGGHPLVGLQGDLVDDPELEGDLSDAVEVVAVHHAGVGTDAGSFEQLGFEPVQDLVGELIETDLLGQADQREGHLAHAVGPGIAPSQLIGDLPRPGRLVVMRVRPDLEVVPVTFGHQQIHVGADVLVDETPRQQRPGSRPADVQQSLRCRPGHPDVKIGMSGQEQPGGAPSEPLALRSTPQRGYVRHVVLVHIRRRTGSQTGGSDRGHEVPFRARSYSAASVSMLRWT